MRSGDRVANKRVVEYMPTPAFPRLVFLPSVEFRVQLLACYAGAEAPVSRRYA